MAVPKLNFLLATTILYVTVASVSSHDREGLRAGQITDVHSRDRRSLLQSMTRDEDLGADQEYSGRYLPLSKRPFGSLFQRNVLGGKRSADEFEQEEGGMSNEMDDEPEKRFGNTILGGGFKFGKRPLTGNLLGGGGFKLGGNNRPSFGSLLSRGYKFGKRAVGSVLGGGYKFGKRGYSGVLSGGYKFGKRGFGGVLGGGYKFGKRNGEEQDTAPNTGMLAASKSLELAKRPWGNLFNQGFKFGKRSGTVDLNNLITEHLLSQTYERGDANDQEKRANVGDMGNAMMVAKRLFGNVIGGGYKLG